MSTAARPVQRISERHSATCSVPQVGGCMGDEHCVYCGRRLPAEQVFAALLAELGRHLRRSAR